MQALNPYLPGWEFVPDGEPHVFGDRVYVYGSHDRYNGQTYCLNDYVCWSASVDDLADWRYEGVIFRKSDDPRNTDGNGCLFAPDVTQGPDGRYYLYYVLSTDKVVGVAVSDTPGGLYTYIGYVHDRDGGILGEREGDIPQFDPGVLTEGEYTYMYTGFSWATDKSRPGAICTVLEADMLTIHQEPKVVVPSGSYSAGTGFEGQEFFEASSIRKFGDTYYFVYSSVQMYELCYATSKHPDRDFVYGGVIIANNDKHMGGWKEAEKPTYYGGNNHGGLVQIKDQYYIFYHRQTNGTSFSRQTMAERVEILPDGSIPQVEMTSCGLNGGPLKGHGVYPAYCCSQLFLGEGTTYTGAIAGNPLWSDGNHPRVMKDGLDTDEELPYIANLSDTAVCGFKYFDCRGENAVHTISVTARGYAMGVLEVRTELDGPALGVIPLKHCNIWMKCTAQIDLPEAVNALYFAYVGGGSTAIKEFELA